MTTKATATGTHIGTCNWAGHRFFAATAADKATYCPTCEPVTVESNGRPWTQRSSIKWSAVNGREGKKACDEACTSAKHEGCTCKCGGKNHGRSLGLPA